MSKTLHSLHLESWFPGKNLRFVKKLVKPYQKHLRNIHGGANHLEIRKLSPLLTDLRVGLTQETLKMLASHSNIRNLSCDFLSDRFSKMTGEQLFRKYKTSLTKNLAKIKNLKTLSMKIMSREAQAAKLLLEIIDQNVSLDSLKGFSLDFIPGQSPNAKQKANISKVIAKLTHLSLENATWYHWLISSGKLDSLSVLKLHLSLEEIESDSKGLVQFHNLPKLQKFTLSVHASNPSSEIAFFENFSLPSSLEDLSLALTGFTLSLMDDNPALLNQFLQRLQEAKGVKTLDLKIGENATNVALTAKFACLLIKCFENLEILDCKSHKESLFLFGKHDAQAKPLDFQDLLTALTPSKETLQSLSVEFNQILFHEEVNTLDTGFSKLQKIELKDSVWSEAGLGQFCRKISTLKDLTLKGVEFPDESSLIVFLNDMKEIPEGATFELHLDVRVMKQKPLIDCLKKYIEDVKVKGRLGIQFQRVQVEDEEAFGEIMNLVLEKGCFEPFKMVMNVNTLFSVMKTRIIEVTYTLNSAFN